MAAMLNCSCGRSLGLIPPSLPSSSLLLPSSLLWPSSLVLSSLVLSSLVLVLSCSHLGVLFSFSSWGLVLVLISGLVVVVVIISSPLPCLTSPPRLVSSLLSSLLLLISPLLLVIPPHVLVLFILSVLFRRFPPPSFPVISSLLHVPPSSLHLFHSPPVHFHALLALFTLPWSPPRLSSSSSSCPPSCYVIPDSSGLGLPSPSFHVGGPLFIIVIEHGMAVVVAVVVIREGRGTGGWMLGARQRQWW